MPLFTSGGLGLDRVILVLVLRIWSCLHHCQASELVGLAAPSPRTPPRSRLSVSIFGPSSLIQQPPPSVFIPPPQCIGFLIKTLIVPIFGAKECIRMRDFVFKIYKKNRGDGEPRTPTAEGETFVRTHPRAPCQMPVPLRFH